MYILLYEKMSIHFAKKCTSKVTYYSKIRTANFARKHLVNTSLLPGQTH